MKRKIIYIMVFSTLVIFKSVINSEKNNAIQNSSNAKSQKENNDHNINSKEQNDAMCEGKNSDSKNLGECNLSWYEKIWKEAKTVLKETKNWFKKLF